MMRRVDMMTVPPTVGRYYLVPVVLAEWYDYLDYWPVIGPRHNDKEFFNFEHDHYHLDGRFLSRRQRKYVEDVTCWSFAAAIQRSPLTTSTRVKFNDPMPKPVLKRRRCNDTDPPYAYLDDKIVRKIAKHFAGQQCANGKAGWICPHQKVSLGSVAPVDGVITCPLHGLRISADTGAVLSQKLDGASQ